MKILKLSLAISIIQLFCLHQINAENLNAVRVIVNGEIITEFDIQTRAYEAFRIAAQKYTEAGLESKKQEIIQNVIDELIDRKILVQEAKKLLVDNPELSEQIEKGVDTFVKGAVDQVGSVYKFYELANKQGINPLKKRAELKDDLLIEEIMRKNVYRKIIVTPKEIKRYYQDHIDEFSMKGSMSFRHILIKRSSYGSDKEAKVAAEDLLNRLKNGEDFDTLAKEHSGGPHADRGGLWGFDEVEGFRKDLVATISHLKEGEISNVKKSSLGFHIFKIEEIVQAQTLSFMKVQDEIRNTLFREKFVTEKKEYLNKLRKNVVIKRY
ncbi:MAG: peptidylprolyl isomerase [Candidatus Scalindua rubra]|uniref:Peptidyl-prolyl cis-trans isomerase n=1 Tax=Candidatus Scalindua brodae TaxID=237368 RepID=A0A0B0EIQ6_9BACT|nr:MAG: peptidyl-prolyl cis-trans isomerase [Candidatus Scalindua brodae]MBZ0110453.1 peptidylprolyl isomerase [Candidatus Scalindua rubra]TWU36287.1 Chaperone SurA precursor [Candidatus Brocadiaceae bacterium S225]